MQLALADVAGECLARGQRDRGQPGTGLAREAKQVSTTIPVVELKVHDLTQASARVEQNTDHCVVAPRSEVAAGAYRKERAEVIDLHHRDGAGPVVAGRVRTVERVRDLELPRSTRRRRVEGCATAVAASMARASCRRACRWPDRRS